MEQTPQINISRINVGGGLIGLLITLGSMLIFYLGIPLIRYALPVALAVGCAVALVLRLTHHETPASSRILSDRK
jgi:hypothetical protein